MLLLIGTISPKDLSKAICDAQNKQNVIVVAAGFQSSGWIPNWTGAGGVMYPANFDHVIAIVGYQSTEYPSNDTALHKKRMQWYPSGHYGPGIDVTGPAKYVCTSQVIVKKMKLMYIITMMERGLHLQQDWLVELRIFGLHIMVEIP